MSEALPLPPRPNLEQYKKLAKDFQKACKSETAGVVREWALRGVEAIARLQGLGVTQNQINREAARIEQRWHKLKKMNDGAGHCTLASAQYFIAREHGFASWAKFAKHIKGLERSNSPVTNFEAAVDAIVSGDAAKLKQLLHQYPELVRERSTREHRSTLLHYVSANGVEDFRQKTPRNIVEITQILLDAGAEVDAESEAYGGGSTTLGLVATSAHPKQAGVQITLLEMLLERGASMEHPGSTGNGHSAVWGCLANGCGEAARFFASRGAHMNLEEAAGVGRLDVVKTYFDENGSLKPDVTRQQMESGFMHACGYGHAEVVEFLLEKGVHPGWRSKDGDTGLHWATYGPHLNVVKLLLQRGAPVNVRDERFQGTPLDWALYGWSRSKDKTERERCYEIVALLARAGAELDPQWYEQNEERRQAADKFRADPRMMAALSGRLE